MARIFHGVDALIGNTPLVKPIRFEKDLPAELLFKLESMNPMSSVKDRIGKSMIDDAMAKGLINQETTIIEPTSGNTGIALAFVCASRGLKLILTMPDSMSFERQKILKAFGAKVYLTEAQEGMKGSIEAAEKLHKDIPNSIVLGQFSNPSNPEIHEKTTGPEIWNDTDGKVDAVLTGVGTGGTISGMGRYLKSKNPGIKIIAIEPYGSAVISGEACGPHMIQGIGAGFVPDNLDRSVIDEIIKVKDEDAFTISRRLCREEGMMVGISSGAVGWGAVQLCKRPEFKGKTIVAILPSHGERYLSTMLYDYND